LSLDKLALLVAEAAMRRAVGLNYKLPGVPAGVRRGVERVVERLASELAEPASGSGLRCRLCGRGPYTPTGLLLHLRRVHRDQVARRAAELLAAELLATHR